MAGEQGLEPQQAVLETAVLPLYDSPVFAGVPAYIHSLQLDGVASGFHLSLLDELNPPSIHHFLDFLFHEKNLLFNLKCGIVKGYLRHYQTTQIYELVSLKYFRFQQFNDSICCHILYILYNIFY